MSERGWWTDSRTRRFPRARRDSVITRLWAVKLSKPEVGSSRIKIPAGWKGLVNHWYNKHDCQSGTVSLGWSGSPLGSVRKSWSTFLLRRIHDYSYRCPPEPNSTQAVGGWTLMGSKQPSKPGQSSSHSGCPALWRMDSLNFFFRQRTRETHLITEPMQSQT